eukprot:g16014.t1
MSDSDPETIPPDSCSEDEDSDRNLYRNFVLQTELREAIERIQASEVQGQDSDHFEDPDPDDELRIRAGLSYFSEHGAGLPPKNVHAVRRHLFWERHKIRNPAEKGDLWKHDDDTSLLDVVRAQIMEELFRKVYHSKVQSVPPLDRPQFFMDTQKEISEMSSEDFLNNGIVKEGWQQHELDHLRKTALELGYFPDMVGKKSNLTVASRLGPGKSCSQCGGLLLRSHQAFQVECLAVWTAKEDRTLDLAMQMYGKDCNDWKLLCRSHFPGRDLEEVLKRWFLKQSNFEQWTINEDEALQRAIERWGTGNWALMRKDLPKRSSGTILQRFRQLCPEKGFLYDLLLATRRRVMPTGFHKTMPWRQRSELAASDFALRLQVEEEQPGVKRFCTGDQVADRHLSRINKNLSFRLRPGRLALQAKKKRRLLAPVTDLEVKDEVTSQASLGDADARSPQRPGTAPSAKPPKPPKLPPGGGYPSAVLPGGALRPAQSNRMDELLTKSEACDYVEMEEVIGTGAQGQVFACHQLQSPGRRLAAKVVDSQRLILLAEDPDEVVKKLESEVRILRNAEHEHCVSLFDIFRTKRWIVLIMERLEGGELFEQIAKKRVLKELEAKYVMRQIVSGLSFLHGKHIAHRDLKPEWGTYDERVDLWSLGVLLYVMLYGRYPFKGENANEQIKAARFDLSHPKNEPSEEAKDLISALRKLLSIAPVCQAFMLWQHALKVVGQYAQVAQKVTERVLPDLDLAVQEPSGNHQAVADQPQEAQPNLGVELLGMVEGWIQQMTMDGDTTRRLCDELSKQMGDLITEAQKERVLSEAPQVPRPEAISNGADQTRQVLLDGLVAFAEQMSKGAADEGKSQELVELLFMSPGMGAPRLEAGERQIPETKSTSSEEGKPETGQIGYTSDSWLR